MRSIARDFEMACDRWRGLYRAALAQQERATRTMRDASAPPGDKIRAKAARAEAEAQLQLLLAESDRLMQSDFYSYRYFASEGFLPGYNFPRLPLSAFIPGSRATGATTSTCLARDSWRSPSSAHVRTSTTKVCVIRLSKPSSRSNPKGRPPKVS